jgi:hypothetical protein
LYCLSNQYAKDGCDFDSPLETAIVPGSTPGYTIGVWGHRGTFLEEFLEEIKSYHLEHRWGAVEFNPGHDWNGTKDELRLFTRRILHDMYRSGCTLIAPIAWVPSQGDAGVKNTGVDEGIKEFIVSGR